MTFSNEKLSYKSSVYSFYLDHVVSEVDFFKHIDGVRISDSPILRFVGEGASNYVWREETGDSWIDYREGEFIYSYHAKVNLVNGMIAYSHFPRLLKDISSEFRAWTLECIYHSTDFLELVDRRMLLDGIRCVDTLYHETNQLIHWHRCWNCLHPFRQKHQIIGFKHSHSCGAVLCNTCVSVEPKYYFLWSGLLSQYNPLMEPREFLSVEHQAIFPDFEGTKKKFDDLAGDIQRVVDKSDGNIEDITAQIKLLIDSVQGKVTLVASAWTILAAIGGFIVVLSFFLSRRDSKSTDKELDCVDVVEHQAYNLQDNNIFSRVADLVDTLIELPWKFSEFVKTRWTTMLKIGKDLHSFKQGLLGLDFFATKCGEILQDFLKWATGKQIFFTECARQKYVRTVEMTAALHTLRTFLETEVATMLASKIRTEAFLTSHCYVAKFVDDYRGEKDPKIRSLVTVGETVLRSTAPMHRSLFEEEHPCLQYHPYGVAFCGVPGAGKSFLASKLNKALCEKILVETGQIVPKTAELYMKNEKDQFWPGYAWQFGVLIDDLGQNRKSELPAELISLYGDNKVYLNMASLGDKGRAFGSRVLYTTMNGDGFPRPNDLATPEALWRRRDVLYEIRVSGAYLKNGQPDLDYGAEDDFWIFVEKDKLTGAQLGVFYSFETLLERTWLGFKAQYDRRYGENKNFPMVRHGGDNYLAQKSYLMVIDPFVTDSYYLIRPKDYTLEAEEGIKVLIVSDSLPDQETRTLYDLFAPRVNVEDIKFVGSVSFAAFYGKICSFFKKKNYVVVGAVFDGENATIGDIDVSEETTLLSYLQVAGVVLSAILVSGILYMLIKMVWRFFKPEHQSAVAKGKLQLVRAQPLVMHPRIVHQASGLVDEGGARVLKKVFSNLVSLSPKGERMDHRIFGLFIGDHRLLVNRHVMKVFPDGSIRCALALDLANFWTINLDYGKKFEYGEMDMLIFDLIGQNFQPFPDIRKHIVSELDNLPQPGVGLFARVIDGVVEYETIPFDSVDGFRGPDGSQPYYTYHVATQGGQCGLPLFGLLQDKRVRVIGIHSVGVPRGTLGMSVPLTSELFDRFKMTFPNLEFQAVFVDKIPKTPFPVGLQQLGTMKKPIFMNTKSAFQKSPLYGRFGQVDEGPSVISWNDSKMRGNGEFPGLYGVQSYVYDGANFDPREIEDCAKDVGDFLSSFGNRELYARVLTDVEMINGTNLPHLGHFDMSTSPGYPWKDMRTEKGKYDFFQIRGSDIEWRDTPAALSLQEAIRVREEKAKLGERVESYWVDNLKDEILPLPKILGSKTRVFVNGPLDHTLLCRKYMGGFLAHMMRNRVENFTGPGLVESGPDWDLLYRRLISKGDNIIDGDHKTWDKHLSAALMWATRIPMDIFYGGEGSKVREVLLHEIIWTICVMGDVVYVKRAGNVSGCYGTTSIINNVSHLILLTYMWRKIMRRSGCLDLISWPKMTEHLYMNVFGDDHILSVSDRASRYFNMESLQNVFNEYNMQYTTSRKKEIDSPFSTIKTATYLKRTFVLYKGKCLGLRTIPEILSILNWMRYGNVKELMGMSCTMVCLEMWKHGEELYDYWINKIRVALREVNLFLTFPSWQQMEELWDLKTSLVALSHADDTVCSFENTSLWDSFSSDDTLVMGGPVNCLVN